MAEGLEPPFDRPDAGFNDLPGWTWIGTYGGHYLQADLLADFAHGFFTRRWQGRPPEVLAGFLSAGVSVHRPQQIHSALVVPASTAVAEPWPEADGLVSDGGGQSLWVCGADCTPVLLADPASGQVAACHAGWRGVAARILPEAVARLVARGARANALLVALGPAIAGERYQVERGVSEQVAASLGVVLPAAEAARLAWLQERGVLAPDGEPGRDRLDIRAAACLQLQQLGVPAEQISTCPLCTAAEPLLFHSWRRDQVKAVQWSGIVSQA
ncbi:MAG: peptidoglycan editing factor PgeF [Synechococcaceae cyanobacterium]|nr:peptidoglycan editing factor PgeF [Synechococcaceae cyanobacterium]